MMSAGQRGDQRVGVEVDRRWSVALALLGLLAAAVPWFADVIGLSVPVDLDVEVADHLVPGIVVAGVSIVGSLLSSTRFWIAAVWLGICFLSGVWMTTTHVPLLIDAKEGQIGWPEALFHSVPGTIVTAVAFVVLVTITSDNPSSSSPRHPSSDRK